MNKEHFFIHGIASNDFIGDDGAVIGSLVYSQDAFFEDVHFKRDWMDCEQIAYKAMMVNISDAIVMNAHPRYALLTVAMPPEISYDDITLLQRGFRRACEEFGITIIGGDTIQNCKLDLSITIIASTQAPVYRTGLKEGDMIAYTGVLGEVDRDLQTLLHGGRVTSDSRFITPQLRPDFFYRVAPYLRSALDISDGLFSEMQRLSEANHCGFVWDDMPPCAIGCSGEEYEILLGFDPQYLPQIEKIAKETNTPLTTIARVTQGSYVSPCQAHHF